MLDPGINGRVGCTRLPPPIDLKLTNNDPCHAFPPVVSIIYITLSDGHGSS